MRGAPRKFDWDEARRLRAEGLSYPVIAERFSVSAQAVRLACDDEARRKSEARARLWQRMSRCPDCGKQTNRLKVGDDRRCVPCAGRARATSVRDDALQCFRCREWKPDDEFPHNRQERGKARRGRHNYCRPCSTEARREFRDTHREQERATWREQHRRRRERAKAAAA